MSNPRCRYTNVPKYPVNSPRIFFGNESFQRRSGFFSILTHVATIICTETSKLSDRIVSPEQATSLRLKASTSHQFEDQRG